MAENVLSLLRRVNRIVALAIGLVFLACAGVVLVDITLRRLGSSLGGTDEISGYVMAICTAWGMAFAMLELAHVRIDFLRSAAGPRWRAIFDLLAMFALAATVSVIAVQCWPVVATSLKNSSRANTPLETPLSLVQVPWFAGWVWFAIMAWFTLLAAAALVAAGRFERSEEAIGAFTDQEAR